MEENDDMHRSLFSNPLSHNSTEKINKFTLELREMSQKEIITEANNWLKNEFYVEFDKKRNPTSRLKMTDLQYNSTIGYLVKKLEERIKNRSEIPPDFLAGLQTALGDLRTSFSCGTMSQKSEDLLIAKAKEAMKLLQ